MDPFALIGAGGPIVVLLLVLSGISLAIIIGKLVQIARATAGRGRREQAIAAWTAGGEDGTGPAMGPLPGAVGRVLAEASDRLAPLAARRARAERVARSELARLRSFLRLLEVVAVVSPLLGLLGTVIGLIEAFQSLEAAGGGANASVLSGGIWQALLTTACGLVVAIPAAAAASLLDARVDRVALEMEDAAARVLGEAATGG